MSRWCGLAVAGVLLLAGCGGGTAPAVPAASSSSASSTARSTADMAYLAAVVPHVAGNAEADLIRLGRQSCTDLASGKSQLDVGDGLTKAGFSTEAAATIVTAAVAAYCPGSTGAAG